MEFLNGSVYEVLNQNATTRHKFYSSNENLIKLNPEEENSF